MIDDAEKMAEDAARFSQNPNDPSFWPDPLPIYAELCPVEPFKAQDLLPNDLANWVMDTAGRMPCPPDFVAAAAMVALGSVIGAQCVIKPKTYDDWVVVPNLWGAIVGLPSAKKSPAMGAALKPLDRITALAKDAHQEELTNFLGEELVLNARKDALKHQLKDAAKNEQNKPKDGE